MRRNFSARSVVVAMVATLTLFGCSKKENEAATFTQVYEVFSNTGNCVNCHSGSGQARAFPYNSQLDLSSRSLAYSGLTSLLVTSANTTGCSSVRLVTSGNSNASYLAGILLSSYTRSSFAGVSTCTPAYSAHSGYMNLSQVDQEKISRWIDDGAKDN